MGDMAVLVFRVVDVLAPLLQLSVLSHFHLRELVDGVLQTLLIGFIHTQYACGGFCLREDVVCNLVVHRA